MKTSARQTTDTTIIAESSRSLCFFFVFLCLTSSVRLCLFVPIILPSLSRLPTSLHCRSVIAVDPPVALILEPPVRGIRIEDALGQFLGFIRNEPPDGKADPFAAVCVTQIAAFLQLKNQ